MSLFNKDARENQLGTSLADIETIKASGDITYTTDTTNLQNAINNNKKVVLGKGTFYINSITIPNDTVLEGVYGETIIQANTNITSALITRNSGVKYVAIRNMVFDMNNNVNGQNCISLMDCTGALIENNIFKNGITRSYVRADYPTNPVPLNAGNMNIRNNIFQDNTNGGAINFNASYTGIYNISVTNNLFKNVGSDILAFFAPVIGGIITTSIMYYNVEIIGNIWENVTGGPYGAIPLELWCVDKFVISDNILDSGTRGLGTGNATNGVFSNNSISNQTLYAHELGGGSNITFTGETIYKCQQFINDTGASASQINIIGNTIVGSNMTSNQSKDCIQMPYNSNVFSEWNIQDNLFVNYEYGRSYIRVDGSLATTSNIMIKGNTFVMKTEYCPASAITLNFGQFIDIIDNRIIFEANYTSNNPSYNNSPTLIGLSLRNPESVNNVNIMRNNIDFKGTTSGSGFSAIGNSASTANPASKVKITHNTIKGAFTPAINCSINSGDTVIRDNDTAGVAGHNNILTLNSNIVYQNNLRTFAGTAIPTTGTWLKADRIVNSSPATGQPKAWVCTVNGTFGTLNGGATTGSITSGTSTLTVNSTTGLAIGNYILIAGVTGAKQVIGISGTTVTLDYTADATVTNAVVSYSSPTWVSEGNL